MVNPDFLAVINTAIVALAAKYGVPNPPQAEQYVDEICVIRFSKHLANDHADEIDKIADDLEKVDGVSEMTDSARQRDRFRGIETRDVYLCVKRKHWTKTAADRAYWKEEELYYDGDPGAVARFKAKEAEKREEMRKYYKEFILPIPKPSPTKPTELYLTMAYEPYDLIKKGEKVTEFRAYCETWVKRILANMGTLRTVKFQRGYGGPGRPKPEQMIWTIKKIDLYDIETRESSDPINVKEGFLPTHIAIDLGVRMDDVGPATEKDK